MVTAITALFVLITLYSLVHAGPRWLGMMSLALLSWVLDPFSFTALLAFAGGVLYFNQRY
ncbi:hypothetical protein [Nitrosomonas communis]|uniref:hypothetical protein n=1 Tax=Nitrosomonas communis TaxID=44574 RepID=UPI00094207F6|nr:hypothetical protein [Nitrosomonas communis]